MMTLNEQCQLQRAVIERRRQGKAMVDNYLRVMRLLNGFTKRAKAMADAVSETHYGEAGSPQHRRWLCWRHITNHVARFYRNQPFDPGQSAHLIGVNIGYGELYSVILGELRAREKRRKGLELRLQPNDAGIQAEMDGCDRTIETLAHALRALELAHEGWSIEADPRGKKRLNVRDWGSKDSTNDPETLDT